MKTIRETLASWLTARCSRSVRGLKSALILAGGLAAGAAAAQPANDLFTNAIVLAGTIGTTNGDNTLASLEPCEAIAVGTVNFGVENQTNSLWYVYTAPGDGTLQLILTPNSPGYDFILSAWGSPNASPVMCDGTLTNITAIDTYDNTAGGNVASQFTIPVAAGAKYYVCVASWDDGSSPNAWLGTFALQWNGGAPINPVIPASTFSFSSTEYDVSETDSSAPVSQDNNTVSPSVLGARITVTRPLPAYGRVLVDYTVSSLLYTNYFRTNWFGTNVLTTFIDTNGTVSYTNFYSTNILTVSRYQYYLSGYNYYNVTNATTNASTLILHGVITTNYPVVSGPLAPADIATNLPLTNSYTLASSGPTFSFITNFFGYLVPGPRQTGRTFTNGTIAMDGSGNLYTNLVNYYTNSIVTNFYGENIFLSYTAGNRLFSTNYYYTNIVAIYSFFTNSVYTNGVLAAGGSLYSSTNQFDGVATNFAWSFLNASNRQSVFNGSGRLDPPPTNLPPLGNVVIGTSDVFDTSSNEIITVTNRFNQVAFGTNQVNSSFGFTTGTTTTLTFDNLQMSQDIILPVQELIGPDAPDAMFIPSDANIILSNPRLDPGEDATFISAPGVSPTAGLAHLSAASPDFVPVPGGLLNFERSTFRTLKSINNSIVHNATISVTRNGGAANQGVSVDYIINPTPGSMAGNYGGYMPPQNYNAGGYQPANTFPLQAGSDYAFPNSDFFPVSGTLTWGAYDFNPKQITIVITNNGVIEQNQDLQIQLYNPIPGASSTVPAGLGEVNLATLTILFDTSLDLGNQYPGQQPAGAVDRSWNKDNEPDSNPPNLQYPGTTPGDGGTVYAVAEQPDGNAIIAGSFVSYDSTPYNRIVRVLPNGYQDPTFQGNTATLGNNSGANNFIAALALQPDGRIIIGGNFTAFNGFNRHYIARLNSNGSLDTTFNPGLGANATVWAVALQPNGQLVIGGDFTSYNGTNISKVARLNADGTLDTTFNPGAGPDGTVDALALDASGRVIIGGDFSSVSGTASGGVARLNLDGLLDNTFAVGIGTFNANTYVTEAVHALAVQPDGNILVGGSFSYYNLASYNGLLRLKPDGTLDSSFHPGIATMNPITSVADSVYSILLQPDGRFFIGGNFMSYNETRRIGLARVFSDGSLDTSFMDTYYNEYAGVPSRYFTSSAVATDYPTSNTRSAIYAIALETNAVTTATNVIIGGSFYRVGGGYTRNDIHPRSNVARVIGLETPGPGNIEFSYTSYSVDNSAGTLYVSLTRTNGNLGPASVTFATNTAAPGPGVASGADFSLDPKYANPTWDTAWWDGAGAWDYSFAVYGPNYNLSPPQPHSAGGTGAVPDVYVSVANPGNIKGNLSANFTLTNPISSTLNLGGQYIQSGVALGPVAAAPLTIIDSNVKSGVLGFSSPVYTVIENGTTAVITVTRTNGSGSAVTVFYATSDGTATNGVDYTGSTNQLSFAIGQTNATFNVPTHSKYTSIQPDKTVNLRLFTPGGGATLGASNAVLTLVNPNYDHGHISFSMTNYLANENSGSAIITVNRLGGSTGTLGVTLKTSNGTAISPTNYLAITTNLFWNNSDATPRTIAIPVFDDGVATADLIAYLQLTNSQVNGTNNATPLTFGGTNATLTVVNVDNAGSFQFGAATYAVKKYGGYALIPVIRTGGSVGTVSVTFTTADDTAVKGTDYVYTSNTLTFASGQVSQTVTVPVITTSTNGLVDLFLQLSNPTGLATLGTPNPAKLYIIDSSSINETPGSPDPTYSPFAGFNNNVNALVLQTNNQLLVGGDFTMANGVTRNHIARLNSDGSLDAEFSFPSSSMGADGPVRAIALQADNRILIGGFFTNFNSNARGHVARLNADGTLDNIFNPGSGADNPVYAVAQTFVNGNPKVLIAGSFVTVGGTTFNGVAQLNDDGTPDWTFNAGGVGANATVYALLVQSDGKILIGGDFTTYNGATNFSHLARLNQDGSVDTSFLVSASGANGSVRAIALQSDGRILIGGFFTSVNGTALNHIARLNVNGTLDGNFSPGVGANDAVFAFGLQTDGRIVVGGQFSTCSGVTRSRITRLNPNGKVDPTINFLTGANDYVGAIAIVEDTIAGYPADVPDEKIIIGGGFTQYFGQTHQRIARIFGGSIGGSGSFQFSSAYYGAHESASNAVITVWRTGGTTNAPTGDVFVTTTTSNGTAVAGINYVGTTNILDFPLGEVVRTFAVTLKDDGVVTPDLTVNLAISSPTAPAQIGNQPSAQLIITNDDSTVSFASPTYSVARNVVSGVAPINIVRNGGISSTSVVSFATTTNGTAIAGTDYTPVSQTVVFTPGVSNIVVPVTITNNGIPEGDRTVTMALTNVVFAGVGAVALVAPSNAVLTIIDTTTAPGQLFFTATNFSANASDGYAYLTVVRTNGSAGVVTATYYTVPGTAQPGLNYVSTVNGVTFADGQTQTNINVQLINNPLTQSGVSFTVNLANPTGGASLLTPTNSTVTIFNTNAVISFTLATNTVPENAGVANILVQRQNKTNIASSVSYATVNGTAVAGINFSNTFGILNFAVGESLKSISIPLINRSNIMDLMFSLNLSGAVNAQLVAPSSTLIVEQGSAAGISFTTNAATVQKNAGGLVVTVVCSNPRVEPVVFNSNTVPLQVTYKTVDGTAKAGFNYQAVTGTLVFTNGIGTNSFVVPIFNNQNVSGDQTFSVILTNVTAPGRITPYGTQTVNIAESNPGLRFSQASYTYFKNAGLAAITVIRTGFTNSTCSVDYLVTNDTAIAGINYYPTNGTLVFSNGVTSQSFNVQLIANSQVQPNLVALLALLNPTNGTLVNPSLATLTILENGGSYVIPAGAMVVTNYTSHKNDGLIGSNDLVQVMFAFRDSAGLNVTNLVATLLATNGVLPVNYTTTNYGPLTVYGHSVSRPFTFTAQGFNAPFISPTFLLYDNARYIGTASFVFSVGLVTTTFVNSNTIVINDNAASSPYPSVISVSGLGSTLFKATVTLNNLSHRSVSDIDALVVSPATNTLIMAHAGQNSGVFHVTLTFDDAATNSLPQNGSITTGTNKPTQFYPVKNFP